jgi:hypothetical protein
VDDISAAGLKETRRLFSKCTCNTQKYEAKGEKTISMPEFSNLYITANSDAPLHTHPGDRRQLILEASELHTQDRKFFSKVSEEFKSLDIAHAWYTFLKDRDLNNWHPSIDPPSNAKSKTIEACMVKSHVFMNDFFCDDAWLLAYITEHCRWFKWTAAYQAAFCDKGDYRGKFYIRIEHKRMFLLYRNYMRANYPSSKPRNIDTFFKELERIDIIKYPKRRSLNGKKKHVVDIFFHTFAAKMRTLYPNLEINEWDSVTKPKEFISMLIEKHKRSNFN